MHISKGTRETIKTSAVLLVIVVLLLVFLVYPLTRVPVYFGRTDGTPIPADTLPANDASLWFSENLRIDTFRIEADGMTKLAELEITRPGSIPAGTIVVVPDINQSRDELVSLVEPLLDGAARVVVYDQRASGLSSGFYHGDGQIEAADLLAVITELSIHGRLVEPLAVIGFGVGGDAALLAAQEEHRIALVTAVNPHVTTANYVDSRVAHEGGFWFPFRRSLLWWWYQMRTGVGESPRGLDELKPVAASTTIFVSDDWAADEAIERLRSLSPTKLAINPWPTDTLIRPALLAASVMPLDRQSSDNAEPAR